MREVRVEHALICEDARTELGGKTTVIGLFGASPHVSIEVPNFGVIARLCFFFMTSPSKRRATQRLTDFTLSLKGKHDIKTQRGDLPLMELEPGKTTQMIFTIGNVQLSEAGRYRFEVRDDDGVFAEAEFEVALATPGKTPPT